MRTALRTYHPVPSLQKTDGNLQDAPRIKNTLKFCRLAHETASVPMAPNDVVMEQVSLEKPLEYDIRLTASTQHAGRVPSTSVVNLVFVLANHFVVCTHDIASDCFPEICYRLFVGSLTVSTFRTSSSPWNTPPNLALKSFSGYAFITLNPQRNQIPSLMNTLKRTRGKPRDSFL